jgi:hypothetical protein
MAVNLRQTHFRFGIAELAESTHGWHAAEDANATIPAGQKFLLRITEQETGGTAITNVDAQFQYSHNSGTWTNITTTSSPIKAVPTGVFANAADLTKRLSGTGTFESSGDGGTHDGLSGGQQNDIAASGNSETECALLIDPLAVADGDTIDFRLTSPDTTIGIDVTPRVTVSKDIWQVQGVGNQVDVTGQTTITAALTGITAGNLIAVWVQWEAADGAPTVSDGTSSLVAGTKANSGTAVYGQWFYLLSANSGDKTFTATFSPAVNSPEIFVTEVRRTSGTWALDAQNTGSGSSNSALSGTINASADSFVFGGYGPSGTGEILSAMKINAVEAFQPPYTPQDGAIWHRPLTAAFTGGAASATMGGSAAWVCNIIAFKEGQIQKSLADSGSGADVQTISTTSSLADSGSGADAETIAAVVNLADVGGETGVGIDALSIAQQVAKAIADSGAGADAISALLTALLAMDTGSGVDAATILAGLGLSDSGAGSDVVAALNVVLSVVESGSGADIIFALQSALALADSGSGLDALSVEPLESPDKQINDSGTGSDVQSVFAVGTLLDSGSGVDTKTILANIFL